MAPVAAGLFTWPSEEPRLIGSSCHACGTVAFPAQPDCSRCGGQHTGERRLGRRGLLWSFTVQGFPPKAPPYLRVETPESFAPFGVGLVELPGEVKVQARLTESEPSRLRIGMEMELTVVPLTDEIVTFAFRPVEGSGR